MTNERNLQSISSYNDDYNKVIIVFSASISQYIEYSYRILPNHIGIRTLRNRSNLNKDSLDHEDQFLFKKIREKNKIKKSLRKEILQSNIQKVDEKQTHDNIIGQFGLVRRENLMLTHTKDKSQLIDKNQMKQTTNFRMFSPSILSSPMVNQAVNMGLFMDEIQVLSKKCCHATNIIEDKMLASQWALYLKEKMSFVEKKRLEENMRPLAYQLNPDVWHHQRPSKTNPDFVESIFQTKPVIQRHNDKNWGFTKFRRRSLIDSDISIIYEYLYCHHKNLHISCGAKFGCDFLLYNGQRDNRHGFAGLRVYGERIIGTPSTNSSNFPISSSYDLVGYVRGLNTAGKLALIAMVDKRKIMNTAKNIYHVAFVYLALDKIL